MTQQKKSRVRLAIIGTGGMANVHAQRFRDIRGCHLVAACDINRERAEEFAKRHSIPHVFEDAASLLAGVDCDAVSIVTPDSLHKPLAIECLQAGKHVLCEKPLALNAPDAKEMLVAARAARVVHAVNFTYRGFPCIQAAARMAQSGDLGEVRHVEASYLQAWLVSKAWGDWRTTPAWLWRLSKKHGSAGVLGDVGVHIVDFATFPAGPIREVFCRLKAFPKAPRNRIGEYRLDANDSAVLNVEFINGALGVIHASRWVGGHANRLALKIAGTEGTLAIDTDWGSDVLRVCRGKNLETGTWKEIRHKPVPTVFQRFITAIRTGGSAEPDFARGAEIQRVLDASFDSDARRLPVRV